MVSEGLGDYDKAAKAYKRLLDNNPAHPFAARRLVAILTENGAPDAAKALLTKLRGDLLELLQKAGTQDQESVPAIQLALARVIEDQARLEEREGNLPDAFAGWQDAIKLLAQARKNENAPPAILNELVEANQALGELYFQQRAYEQAEEVFTEVVLVAPDKTNGTLWRARARKAAGDLLGSVEDYNTIITAHPQRASYLYERAEAWFLMKDVAKALKDCSDANLLDASNPLVYNLIGEAYLEAGDYPEAIDFFSNAIGLDPRLFRAYQRRAEAYLKMEDYQKAAEEFTYMIELQPHRHSAFGNRGLAYLKLGKFEDAIRDFSHVIQYYPDDALAYYNRGNAYSYLKTSNVAAVNDYSEALRIRPDFARAFNNRGLVYLEEEEYDKALKDFTAAVDLDPSFDFAYNNRGQTQHKLQQMEKALDDYSMAIKINPKNDSAFYNRGVYFMDTNAYQRALEDLNRAIELRPDEPEYYRTRAVVLGKLGKLREAEEDVSRANRLDTEREGRVENPRSSSTPSNSSPRQGEAPLSAIDGADLFQ